MARSDFTESSYDINEIYTGSQDQHGHSANFRCSVPKHWNGAIQALVNSPEWSWRSTQEFMRDAAYHRLQWAAAQGDRTVDPAVRSAVALAGIEAKINRLAADRENADALRESLRSNFDLALRVGDSREVRVLINEFEDIIMDEVREPFRSQLLDELSFWAKRAVDL